MDGTEISLILLGDCGVGKSCSVVQFCQSRFIKESEWDPTIEASYRTQVSVDDDICKLHILDTAGEEEYTALLEIQIKDNQGIIMMYSIQYRYTFEAIMKYYDLVIKSKQGMKINTVLVGNKCDLEEEREVSFTEGQALARKLKSPFFETSAKKELILMKFFLKSQELLRIIIVFLSTNNLIVYVK